jgi:LL-diaminopimelate aminotransferase
MADASTSPAPAADPWFQPLFADRIGGANYGKGSEIYKFEKIKRAKRTALTEHPERQLLDFGIGENDDMADPAIRDRLKVEVDKLENRGEVARQRGPASTHHPGPTRRLGLPRPPA